MNINTKSFYESLEQRFGPDVVNISLTSSESIVTMVAVDGSLLLSGWLQDRGKTNGRRNPQGTFGLAAIPDHAKHSCHSILLQQFPSDLAEATVTEIDDYRFLAGFAVEPTILFSRAIGQPAISGLIENYTANALVLNTDEAYEFNKPCRMGDISLDELRAEGLALRAQVAGGVGYVEF